MAGRKTFFFEGLGVSDGIAIGPAYVIETDNPASEAYEIPASEIEHEIARFEEAVRLAKSEVRAIGNQIAEHVDRQQAAIFDAHQLMLEDPYLIDAAIKLIRSEKRNAESIFWDVTRELGQRMEKASGSDAYFSERNHDLYDVARRVIRQLRRLESPDQAEPPRDRCIVVAGNLGPAETAQFSRDHVLGFCVNEGGATGHAAILARALGIPAVMGLEVVTRYVRTGDMLIVDGSEGKVILHPTADQLEHYQARAEEYAAYRKALHELCDVPAVTTDGTRVALFANIELPEEIIAVRENGAEGVGLVRTEFLYLEKPRLPTFDEQVAAYKKILDGTQGCEVVLRTLDLGGDKLPAYTEQSKEANPFMGTRAIRLCLNQPDIFRVQLRAIVAAAADREVSILLPMISGLDEVRQSRRLLDEILDTRRGAGEPVPTRIRLGAMVEIPSAALMAEALCREVDFLSIGTNDLVQYTLAVDRGNRGVASLYRESHPAVLWLIKRTVEAGAKHDKPVTVCGEMSSDPRYAILLVGMGVRTLSMTPSALGPIKRVICGVSIEEARVLAREALSLGTPEEVENLLRTRLKDVIARLRKPLSSGDGVARIRSAQHSVSSS